ncbi:MAG: hypothetical protein JXR11_00020 [Balneola sp.]
MYASRAFAPGGRGGLEIEREAQKKLPASTKILKRVQDDLHIVIPAKAGIWIVITGMFLKINPDLGHTPRDDFAFEDYF